MVRRLVHQQDIRLAEQHARHGHAHLPSARERADVAIDPRIVEAEPLQHFPRLAFERVAAEVIVFLLHLAEALEDLVHLVGAIGIAKRVLKLGELVMQIAQPPAAGNRLVQDRTS